MKNPCNLETLTPAEYYVKGLQIIKENENEGIKYLLTAAENNYVRAYHVLGMHYAFNKDYVPALNYIFKAYENGYFDLKELLYVYINAYINGHKSHKKVMLEIMERVPSLNVIKDYTLISYIGIALFMLDKKEEAGPYLKKATRKEEGVDAYYYLGLCYRHGFGVEKDIEYSYTCFRLANDFPTRELVEKELNKYKRKGLIKKKWKYRERYAKKKRKLIE